MPDIVLNDLLGKPWRLGARGPKEYDCWGLCQEVARRAGITLPHYTDGDDLVERSTTIETAGRSRFRRITDPTEFCLATFRLALGSPDLVTHIGIVLPGCKRFMHILAGSSVTVERLDRKLWKSKLDGFYEFDS